MIGARRDPGFDVLLDLNGQIFVLSEKYWVKFVVVQVEVSDERPHGLSYSLTLHDASGERLVGFDNAHAISGTQGPSGRGKRRYDHRHRLRSVRPYDYKDAASLLADFWTEVDAVLHERGETP